VIDLRNRIRDAISSVQGDVPEAADDFRPHVTIAYSGEDAPAGPIRKRLVPLRNLGPTTVYIDSVDLICLRRDQRVYRWDTYAVVPLGAASER
jgi:2'-5' RNA ligase